LARGIGRGNLRGSGTPVKLRLLILPYHWVLIKPGRETGDYLVKPEPGDHIFNTTIL